MTVFFWKYRCFFLLILSSVLFGLSNQFTSFIVFVPVLFLVGQSEFKYVWLWGGLYGALSYFLYASWLFAYSSIAAAGVCSVYFIYCAVLFVVLKSAESFGGRFSVFLQTAVLVLYEYLKTLGYLGFSYGITGYTQYRNIYFIQIADFAGVFGVSAVLVFSSAVVYNGIAYLCRHKRCVIFGAAPEVGAVEYSPAAVTGGGSLLLYFLFLFILICSCYIYGFFRVRSVDARDGNRVKIKVAAIQNNTDPWKGGVDFYRKDIECLLRLSAEALEKNPDTKLVVWPETAVVPSIIRNYYEGQDSRRKELVTELLNFIDRQSSAFLIGNFNDSGGEYFNSAFLFIPGKNVVPPEPEVYSKIHLVPFSEWFPYGDIFPGIYKALLDGDTHLWSQGTERTVFNLDGFKFSSPICFEDTFGSDCRKFVRSGAGAFINMSNDAWAGSAVCQKQHLQMAVFRSIENHVPSVRSTASGVTCIIDSSGRIKEKCAQFRQDYVVGEISVCIATQ